MQFPSANFWEINAAACFLSSSHFGAMMFWGVEASEAERKNLFLASWVLSAEAVQGSGAGDGWTDLGTGFKALVRTELCCRGDGSVPRRGSSPEVSDPLCLAEDLKPFWVQRDEEQRSVPGCWPHVYAPDCKAAAHSQHLTDRIQTRLRIRFNSKNHNTDCWPKKSLTWSSSCGTVSHPLGVSEPSGRDSCRRHTYCSGCQFYWSSRLEQPSGRINKLY